MKRLYLFALIALLPALAGAQLISNPNAPVPAAQAVGGAFTAAADGADAVYCNPSGLAFGKGSQGRFVYHQPWGAGFLTHLSVVGFTTLPKNAGGIALSVQNLGTRTGGYTMSSETEIALTHGFILQRDIHSSLAFGYALKFISYSLGESAANEQGVTEDLGSASTFGLDIGATAQLWDRFRLGAAFKNINQPHLGSDVKEDLPRIFSAGISYFPYYGVRSTFDVERLLAGETQFKAGINAEVVKPLDLRFGVMSNPNCFTAGFGLHWSQLVLDYAFIYHPVLSPSHQIGLGFNVDKSLSDIWRAK